MAWQPLDGTLTDLDDGGFGNIWQQDFQNSMSNGFSMPGGENMASVDAMEPDWLDLLFDDPTILNDRMFSDALEPHIVQGEHSYSIENSVKTEAVVIKDEAVDKDFEIDILGTDSSPAVTMSHDAQHSVYHQQQQLQEMDTKVESMDDLSACSSVYYQQQGSRLSPGRQTLLKQSVRHDASPSVRLHNIDIHLDVVSVKSECTGQYDDGLPPTPPSSSGSDSEGGQSPQRSAPPSPSSRRSASRSLSTQSSVFVCPQLNAAGVLMLSEEEKRTLVAEGYPIPSKLPLSKADERNLKKVRRKIKNKISAQESRRKKKEYMECLEKRMEGYSRENEGLRKKVDHLESTNRSLLGQLQKLQNLVSRMPRPMAPSAPTGTYFMVLVLFFAVFLGSWSPMSWSIGSMSTSVQLAAPSDVPLSLSSFAKPGVMQPSLDDYRVQSGRSRVMMPAHGDPEDDVAFGPHAPSGRDYFLGLLSNAFLSCEALTDADDAVTHPSVPVITPPVLRAAEKSTAGEVEMAPKVLVAGLMANGSSMRLNTYASATNFHRCETAANCTA